MNESTDRDRQLARRTAEHIKAECVVGFVEEADLQVNKATDIILSAITVAKQEQHEDTARLEWIFAHLDGGPESREELDAARGVQPDACDNLNCDNGRVETADMRTGEPMEVECQVCQPAARQESSLAAEPRAIVQCDACGHANYYACPVCGETKLYSSPAQEQPVGARVEEIARPLIDACELFLRGYRGHEGDSGSYKQRCDGIDGIAKHLPAFKSALAAASSPSEDTKRLREALHKYGDHHPLCDSLIPSQNRDCNCGFADALPLSPTRPTIPPCHPT